jgi:hypothetical protein
MRIALPTARSAASCTLLGSGDLAAVVDAAPAAAAAAAAVVAAVVVVATAANPSNIAVARSSSSCISILLIRGLAPMLCLTLLLPVRRRLLKQSGKAARKK